MKLQIKDKVRVKSLQEITAFSKDTVFGRSLLTGIDGFEILFTKEMEKFCSKEVTISYTLPNLKSDLFKIDEDQGAWNWHPVMFSGLEEYELFRLINNLRSEYGKY